MSLKKRLVSTIASGGLLVAAFAGPAAAHNVTLEQMYMSAPTFGTGGESGNGGVNAQMWLSIEDHPGTVMITLKKKNAAGDWVNAFSPKQATYQPGWGYTYTFKPIPGDKRCKAKGVFTKANHTTVKGVSKVGPC
jgi:hypothetical protein